MLDWEQTNICLHMHAHTHTLFFLHLNLTRGQHVKKAFNLHLLIEPTTQERPSRLPLPSTVGRPCDELILPLHDIFSSRERVAMLVAHCFKSHDGLKDIQRPLSEPAGSSQDTL